MPHVGLALEEGVKRYADALACVCALRATAITNTRASLPHMRRARAPSRELLLLILRAHARTHGAAAEPSTPML